MKGIYGSLFGSIHNPDPWPVNKAILLFTWAYPIGPSIPGWIELRKCCTSHGSLKFGNGHLTEKLQCVVFYETGLNTEQFPETEKPASACIVGWKASYARLLLQWSNCLLTEWKKILLSASLMLSRRVGRLSKKSTCTSFTCRGQTASGWQSKLYDPPLNCEF